MRPAVLLLLCLSVAFAERIYINEKVFEFEDTRRSFDDARDWCHQLGGVLPSVHTNRDAWDLMEYVTRTSDGIYHDAWIGAYIDTNGSWRWDDGTAWDYYACDYCYETRNTSHLRTQKIV